MVLITYVFQKRQDMPKFCYSIENSAVDFINEVKDLMDGQYLIVNVLEISDEDAARWDGALPGM